MVKETIRKALEAATGQKAHIEFSADGKNGHLTSNIALMAAKEKGMAPRELAEKLKNELEAKLEGVVDRIEVAGPGFLNFFLTNETIEKELGELAKHLKNGFGFRQGEKINVEFISANPTGELHIGHGRGAFYGDTLSNMLEFAGAEVAREYYINDSCESNQIKELGKTALGLGETYLTDGLKKHIAHLKKKPDDVGVAGFELAHLVQKENREFIEQKLGIKFDEWYSEDEKLRASLLNDRTFAALKMKDLVYEKDGAWWLKTSEFGDDEDRVVLRSDGSKSYFLSDISYHSEKFGRGYDAIIDVWGADHHGHVKRMQAVKDMLGWKGEFLIFISQLVTLADGKMSKRAGNVVYLRDLVEEFGLDVVRWFYNEKALSTHMEFDATRAKERSEKNPVFYVQYAHARINSMLEKAKATEGDRKEIVEVLEESSAKKLAIEIMRFAEVVEDTARDYQVHRLTTYAYDLASAFSHFYHDVRVIEEHSHNSAALALASLAQTALARSLALMGITAPVKM